MKSIFILLILGFTMSGCSENKKTGTCLDYFKIVDLDLDDNNIVMSARFEAEISSIGKSYQRLEKALGKEIMDSLKLQGSVYFERDLLPLSCSHNFIFSNQTKVSDWKTVIGKEVEISVVPYKIDTVVKFQDTICSVYLVESVELLGK